MQIVSPYQAFLSCRVCVPAGGWTQTNAVQRIRPEQPSYTLLDDLDGGQKYRVLKVSYTATPAEIKKVC